MSDVIVDIYLGFFVLKMVLESECLECLVKCHTGIHSMGMFGEFVAIP